MRPGQVGRQERDGDGRGIGDREEAHVVDEHAAADVERASPVVRDRREISTATPVTNIASVASMNGAPRIAPIPISSEWPPPNRIAMSGIIVSGRAVPTAARTEPTAPSARPSLWPNHSMPLVNSSAPSRMIRKATASRMRSIVSSGSQAQDHCQRHDGKDSRGDDRPFAARRRRHSRRARPPPGRAGREGYHEPEPEKAGRLEATRSEASRAGSNEGPPAAARRR